MAGTVEATVTDEKADMCMVCNTHAEESTRCENHAREALLFCCEEDLRNGNNDNGEGSIKRETLLPQTKNKQIMTE
jgi:hypothetical protein